MKKIRLAYFGTPDFAAHLLKKIIDDSDLPLEVTLVITQPDKPVGRKHVLTSSPVKTVGKESQITVYDGLVKNLNVKPDDYDLALLYAYGEFIPSTLINNFPMGFWNIHPSLLPKYRNVAPIAYPLLLGESETGISIIQLDNKLDHGPIITQEKIFIEITDKRPDLERKLTDLAYTLFKETLLLAVRGNVPPTIEQDHENATYTRKLTKDDGYVPFDILKKYINNETVTETELPQILREYLIKYHSQLTKTSSTSLLFYNFFRGLYPWPGIWTRVMINDVEKRLKITDLTIMDGKLEIKKVQLDGKNEVDFKTFQAAYQVFLIP